MNWWRPYAKRDAEASQRKADEALELTRKAGEVVDHQREILEGIMAPMEEKVSILARINRENNFAVRLAAAYRGGH